MNIIEAIVAKCPVIPANSNYWFVRTDGGALYEAFIASRTIAVNYSKISLQAIKKLPNVNKVDALKALIVQRYPEIKNPGFAANQVLRFCDSIKRGDFILSPAAGTSKVALGIVVDDEAFEEEFVVEDKTYPDFKLRRRVNWIKSVHRADINPKLFGILYTHQAIVFANGYAKWIDPLFYEFFRKGDDVHFIMDISKHGGINAQTLFGACSELLALVDEVAEKEDLPQNSSAVDARVNLNSPGTIEFIAAHPATAVAILALAIVFINGGGLKIKFKGFDLHLGGDGIVKRISGFLNDKTDRATKRTLTEKLRALEVRKPEDVIAILKAIDEKAIATSPNKHEE